MTPGAEHGTPLDSFGDRTAQSLMHRPVPRECVEPLPAILRNGGDFLTAAGSRLRCPKRALSRRRLSSGIGRVRAQELADGVPFHGLTRTPCPPGFSAQWRSVREGSGRVAFSTRLRPSAARSLPLSCVTRFSGVWARIGHWPHGLIWPSRPLGGGPSRSACWTSLRRRWNRGNSSGACASASPASIASSSSLLSSMSLLFSPRSGSRSASSRIFRDAD
jgi:hypothetical protein